MNPVEWFRSLAPVAATFLLLGALGVPTAPALAGAPEPEAPEAEAAAAAESAEVIAEVEEDESSNLGALSITFDNTFTTAYMWRGVINQHNGVIWQPSLELSLNLFEAEEGVVRSVDALVGTWLSVQSEDAGAFAPGSDGVYETDYYPSLSIDWMGGVNSTFTYYFYTSPNDSFPTIEEFAIDLAYDDSEVLGAWAMNPTATFSFETKSSSFGTGKGASVELGIEPGTEVTLPFDEAGSYPLSIAVPFKLGLSMDGYYADGVRDETFGYFQFGLHASVPLACVPERYGELTLNNGFDVYVVNDAIEWYTSDAFGVGDPVFPVWTTSLTLDY
jgi:hypothetical protein